MFISVCDECKVDTTVCGGCQSRVETIDSCGCSHYSCVDISCPADWVPDKPDCPPCHVAELQRGSDPCCPTYECG